jgi:arsenate reductase
VLAQRGALADALLNHAAGVRHEGRSAGSTPGEQVHPEVVTVMDELGLDLRRETPAEMPGFG